MRNGRVLPLNPRRERLRLALATLFREMMPTDAKDRQSLELLICRLEANDLNASEWRDLLAILKTYGNSDETP